MKNQLTCNTSSVLQLTDELKKLWPTDMNLHYLKKQKTCFFYAKETQNGYQEEREYDQILMSVYISVL